MVGAQLGLAFVLAGALVFRLPRLTESLWYDETWSTRVKLGTFAELVSVARSDVHPPLYSTLMFVWIRVFGDSEVSIRIPPLIFGLASIVVAYHLARRLVGVPAAVLVVVMLALSPVHVWYSHEARHYALTLFLVLSLALVAKRADEHDRSVRVHFLLCVLAILTHFYAAVFVAFSGLAAILSRQRGWRHPIFFSSMAALLVGVAFLGLRHVDTGVQAGGGHLRALTLLEAWKLFFSWFPTGYAIWSSSEWGKPAPLALQLMIAAAFVVGLVSLLRRRRADATVVALYLFGPVAVLMLAATMGHRRTYIERSLLPLLPFFLMVLAVGITRIPPLHRQWLLLPVVGSCAVSVFVAFCLKPDEWTVYKPRPDWRAATHYLATEARRSQTGLVVFAGTPVTAIVYYDGSFQEHRRTWSAPEEAPPSLPSARITLRRWLLAEDRPLADRRNHIYVVNLLDTNAIWETLRERGARNFYVVQEGRRVIHGDRIADSVQARIASDPRFELVDERLFKAVSVRKWTTPS
jgi:Dolichyl-phosphate-mannose-protein mannosyltransferase